MKGPNRWIMLAILVLAGIAVAVDHARFHHPADEAGSETETGGYGEQAEAGGYGAVFEDTDDDDD